MKKLQAWLPILFAFMLIIGMITGYSLRERVPVSQGFFETTRRSSIQEAMDLIRLHYVEPVPMDSLSDDAIKAILGHLDPHSIFIPARYLSEINEDLQGNFEGIGVEFQIIRDTVNVVHVLPGGPSAKAGVLPGDKFLKVGDSAVTNNGISSEKIKTLLRGGGGTKVSITFLRNTSLKIISVERGTIPIYSVDAAYMINDTTGFIHLNKFSGTSYEECMAAFEKLNKLGMKKLIFDLRNNGGGILGEAVDIADEFLSGDKLIVYTKGDKVPRVEYHCKRPGQFETGKLMMLVDEGSASASEVLSGAMQDWDRATIIGRRTFGKGLVQEQYNLTGGSALRLTVARYYTPSGRSIQKSYANGKTVYNDEVSERFHNGEVITDSVKTARGKAYKTSGGRKVYGGGGITPDIFVPFDTTGFSINMLPLFANQQFNNFIYRYYLQNRASLDSFKNAKDFTDRFHANVMTWKSLMDFVAENKIQLPVIPEKDKVEIEKRIKSYLGRQIWGMEGFYEVSNSWDLTVQKALQAN
jgi:carboxyl-terminal processing protease